MNLREFLFLVYIFLLPTDGSAYLSFHVGPLSISLLDLTLVLIFFLILLETAITREKFPDLSKKITIFLFAAFLSSLISLFYIGGENMSYDVKVTLNYLEFSMLILITARVLTNSSFLRKVIVVLCVSVFLVSLTGIFKSLGFDLPGSIRSSRAHLGPFLIGVTGFTNKGMAYSTLVLAVLPFVFTREVFRLSSYRVILLSTYILASIISYSRNLWAAIAVQIFLYLTFFQTRHMKMRKRLPVSLSYITAIFFIYFYWQNIYDFLIELRPGTVEQRFSGYVEGLKIATNSPINFAFGSGKGTFIFSNVDN